MHTIVWVESPCTKVKGHPRYSPEDIETSTGWRRGKLNVDREFILPCSHLSSPSKNSWQDRFKSPATDLSRFMALILYVSWKDSCLIVGVSCRISYKNMCKYLARTVPNPCKNIVDNSCKGPCKKHATHKVIAIHSLGL